MDTAKVDYVLHYFRQLYRVPENVKISYGGGEAGVVIARQAGHFFAQTDPRPPQPVIWKSWREQRIPFLFARDDAKPLYEVADGRAIINYDLIAASFFFLSNWQEYCFFKQSTALRYPFSESLQSRLGIAHLPVVNYYFDLLKTVVEQLYQIELRPPRWEDYRWALCLTHDVDTCFHGWPQDVAYLRRKGRLPEALRVAGKGLAGKDAWFNLAEIAELERSLGALSSFYFIARKGAATLPDLSGKENASKQKGRNADYDVGSPQIRETMGRLENEGFEIGVHGSFFSHRDDAQLQEDCRRLGREISGGRFHYLLFENPATLSVIEQAGLRYDSTLGFAEAAGFRNGIAFPFRPYHLAENRPARFLEIPLAAMDTTFRSYQKVDSREAQRQIETLMKEVEKFGGVLTLLWHNNYFTPYKFAGWKEAYVALLQQAKNRGAKLTSAANIYRRAMTALDTDR